MKINYLPIYIGDIAQLGERLNGIQEVSGSIPLSSTLQTKNQPRFHEVFLLISIMVYIS